MRQRTGIIAVGHGVYGTLASGGSAAKQFRRRAAMQEVEVCGMMAARDTANRSTTQVNGDEVGISLAAGREESTLVVLE